ncbi:MAG: hypothetical protein WC872_03310 [Candidatus Absconditabacterales bacterium]|jgi:hypothetical protein
MKDERSNWELGIRNLPAGRQVGNWLEIKNLNASLGNTFFIAKKSIQKNLGKTSAILFFHWTVNQSNFSSILCVNILF